MLESSCETVGTSTESVTDCVYTQTEPFVYSDPLLAIGLGCIVFLLVTQYVTYVFSSRS